MRHQAEYSAAGIAQPRHVTLRAVRVDRVRSRLAFLVHVLQHHLPGLLQSLENPRGPADKVALAVGHRQMKPIVAFQEGALAGVGLQVNPTILKLAGSVPGQGGERPILIGRQDQPGPQESLEAVANAEDELVGVTKLAEGIPEEMAELVAEDLARGHIVAVSETSGNDEDLVAQELAGLLAQAVDVDAFGGSAGLLEGELGFQVAVGTGTTKDEDSEIGHGKMLRFLLDGRSVPAH